MNEIGDAKIPEIKKSDVENNQQMKPETGMKMKDAVSFWKDKFAHNESNDEANASKDEYFFRVGKEEILPGDIPKKYTDDRGVVYREDDRLLPNKSFESNGYLYKTDSNGRLVSAEGRLRVEEGTPRNMENVRNLDSQEYKNSDDRGHVIGHQFGGSDRLENLVPMDSKLNQGDFAKLENKLADAVKAGAKVDYKVDIRYANNSSRPSAFRVSYRIDGEKDTVVFKNNNGGAI